MMCTPKPVTQRETPSETVVERSAQYVHAGRQSTHHEMCTIIYIMSA